MHTIVAAAIVLCSIFVTPWAIDEAYKFRGYEAVGGEYLIIPLGLLVSMLYLSVMSELDAITESKERRRKIEKQSC